MALSTFIITAGVYKSVSQDKLIKCPGHKFFIHSYPIEQNKNFQQRKKCNILPDVQIFYTVLISKLHRLHLETVPTARVFVPVFVHT